MTLPRSWEASYWGQRFTHNRPWRITLEDNRVEIAVEARTFRAPIPALRALTIKPGFFWAAIDFAPKGEQSIRLDGLPNLQARALEQAIQEALTRYDTQQQLAELDSSLEPLKNWQAAAESILERHRSQRRWITHETLQRLMTARPEDRRLETLLKQPALQQHLARHDEHRACWSSGKPISPP